VTLHAAESYGVAIGELERALVDRPERLDSTTVRVLREKLASIDAAIAEALDALAQDPASGYLADHFADLMRRKLSLLRNVASTASFES
jgi:RES domain-containing protein